MYNENEANLKQQQYENATMAAGACGQVQGATPYRPTTPREQAEKNAAYHFEEATKAQKAAAFFSANPAFDEFIMLIRTGVIHV